MRLAIIGSGYVGLVAGTCFADAGFFVTMVDRDADRVRAIREGRCPIWEPGLAELMQRSRAAGRLQATTRLSDALTEADALFVAVGTPIGADGAADLTAVDTVIDEVADLAPEHLFLVLKSTVPPGTNQRVADRLQAHGLRGIDVISNPEFLKEGAAVRDFQSPDRVVIGARTPAAVEFMTAVYQPFMVRSDRMQVMDPVSAEITKYASNAMLAARVSFMNDISRLCEAMGADVGAVRRGIGSDGRIGSHFLYASLGYGGSCFPKDVAALATLGRQVGVPQSVVEATAEVNQVQRSHFAQRVVDALGPEPTGKRAAVWGLAFKAKTDDVRESPALFVIERLRGLGVTCAVHDPAAVDNALGALGPDGLEVVDDPLDALDGAHVLVIATEWQLYRSLHLHALATRMASPVIVDGRNVYKPRWFAGTPVVYHSVGRPSAGGDGSRVRWSSAS